MADEFNAGRVAELRIKNRELQLKKAGQKGGQAGVVATPACAFDWDWRRIVTFKD